MKLSPTALAVVLSSLSSVSNAALWLEKRDAPAVVAFPFTKTKSAPVLPPPHKRTKRDGTVLIQDLNYMHSILYLIQADLGTPPQTVSGQLDTGSPSFIVETVSDNLCSATPPNPCTKYGGYNANASSTYQYLSSDLSIVYGGGDGATGDRAYDVVSVGGAVLQNFYLGLMYHTTVESGVFGVLFTEQERDGYNYQPPRTNLPTTLRDQGYIATRAFSLWTNDIGADGGQVLFGGVDTSKFYGNLVTIDLLANAGTAPPRVTDFEIPLLSVTGSSGGAVTSTFTTPAAPYTVNLDSGTTIMLLEAGLVQNIWDFMGATPIAGDPTSAYTLCSIGDSDKTLDFHFAGVTIKVPLKQTLFPSGDGTNCQIGIGKGSGPTYLLGDFFLGSAYVVYDLDNKQIHMAQTVYNTAASNILQIVAGPNGVPDGPGVGGSTTSSTSSSTTSSSTASSSTTSPSTTSSSTTSSSTASSSTTSSSTTSSSTTSSSTTSSSTTSPSTASSSTTTSSTTTSSSRSTLVTSTVTQKLVCSKNNCFNAVINARAAAFCSSVRAGIPIATPSNIAAKCSALPSKVSSACACYTATASSTSALPPVTTTSSSSSSSSSTLSTTAKPVATICKLNNCYRAVSKTPGFCPSYLFTSTAPYPPNVSAGCGSLPSKISSACACVATV